MSRRKVSPEAQIIALFTGLSDESKRMVMFGLAAITMNESPKSPAPVAVPRSSTKRAARSSTASTEAKKEDASTAAPKGLCSKAVGDHTCGLPYENLLHHDAVYGDYHEFEGPKSKKAAK